VVVAVAAAVVCDITIISLCWCLSATFCFYDEWSQNIEVCSTCEY